MRIVLASFLFSSFLLQSFAQQALSLEDCEKLFVKNNLLLIAEQYNIAAAKAAIIQAKIWQQPYLSGEFNMVNPDAKRAFDVGKNGEMAFAIQQLIYIGGKKKNEVALAALNSQVAETDFEILVSNIRHELRNTFYNLYFEKQKAATIVSQLSNLDSLIDAYSVQVKKANIPLRDLVRLQSLSLSFRNDLIAIQQNVSSENQRLMLITGSSNTVLPNVSDVSLNLLFSKNIDLSIDELIKIAKQKNAVFKRNEQLQSVSERNLRWQKSLAVPDLTIGANYDQQGGAFRNQANLTFGFPLAFWNINRGNIKIAQAQIKQTKALSDYSNQEIEVGIAKSYSDFLQLQQQFKSVSQNSNSNLNEVYKGVFENFQRRNISLLEFTDFMESYNQSVLNLNEIKKQLILSGEQINFITNENLF